MDLDQVLDEAVAEDSTTSMDFSEYVDFALENPDRPEFGTAAEYVHDAITHYGTRTVIEDGEKKERYRFFDDPWNNGENAVFGNTEMLNEFTDSLRRVARGDAVKMPIIEDETATGKSELTEVMKKGLMDYSRTDEGRIHTIGVADLDGFMPHSDQMWKTYGNPDQSHMTPDDYIRSPVQAEPLSLLKRLDSEAGERIEQELQQRREKPCKRSRYLSGRSHGCHVRRRPGRGLQGQRDRTGKYTGRSNVAFPGLKASETSLQGRGVPRTVLHRGQQP